MNPVIEFYPWPLKSPKNNWYRHVQKQESPAFPAHKAGDTLNIKYPSGTVVKARVFHYCPSTNVLQVEAASGTRTTAQVGTQVPSTYKHERAK